ncbi:MAG TPA: hypothetical protein VGW80_11095 [Solirubrobacterales bacterium]|nr:hypothetical protein [Solirubrobacterales bacterium]
MQHSTALALGWAGMGLTAVTTAAAVLDLLPRAVWVTTLILGAALFVVAAVVWRRGDNSASPADPMRDLRGQLAAVDGVRVWLSLRDDPDERLPLDDDRVFEWAKETFKLLASEYPDAADTFMGKGDAPLGSPYFATAYVLRRDQMGRSEYLESRAAMVRRILAASRS